MDPFILLGIILLCVAVMIYLISQGNKSDKALYEAEKERARQQYVADITYAQSARNSTTLPTYTSPVPQVVVNPHTYVSEVVTAPKPATSVQPRPPEGYRTTSSQPTRKVSTHTYKSSSDSSNYDDSSTTVSTVSFYSDTTSSSDSSYSSSCSSDSSSSSSSDSSSSSYSSCD